jgi:hypothetical protein
MYVNSIKISANNVQNLLTFVRKVRIFDSKRLGMQQNDPLVNMTSRWAKKIGRRVAMSRLLSRDVAAATAEKLCTGRYKSSPRERLADILREEMAKDGFFTDEMAS